MNIEFTGERVVPGRVDPDLWNEHISRYVFAKQFCAGARVLDAGTGAGYGCSALAQHARLASALTLPATPFSLPLRHTAGTIHGGYKRP
jgi:hypothetical protein